MINIPKRLSLIAAALTILLTACGGLAGDVAVVATITPQTIPQVAAEPFQMPITPPNLLNGQRIYLLNCTSCHGDNGAGNGDLVQSGQVPRMPSFLEAQHVRQQSPRAYYEMITNGNLANLMPPWNEALTAQERWDVAMYVYTLHYSPALLEQGSQLRGVVAPQFQAESDAELATATGFSGEDAYAVVAYERILSTSGFGTTRGVSLSFVSDPPTPTPLQSLEFQGTITHGTAGATVPESLPVTLRYGSVESGVQVQETLSDAQGNFNFSGVPYDPAYQYFAVVNYQGRGFVSELFGALELSANNLLPISIYESTDDPAVIRMTGVEIVADVLDVEGMGTGLVFAQSYVYENSSDRMYIVTPAEQDISVSLLVQLPVASVIMGGNDPRYLVAQEQYAIVDTLPVYPGAHSVEVLYFVPYEQGAVIDLPLNNPLSGTVDVYLADERLTLSGENFAFVGVTEIGSSSQTQNAKQYRAQLELDAGQSIVFDVSGDISIMPQTTETNTNTIQQYLPIILIVIAVLLLFGTALVIGLRARVKGSDGSSEIDRLIAELAQLEDLHESGRINHDYYQHKRQTMRQRLTELMNQQTDKRES